jgi:hypothetical protein
MNRWREVQYINQNHKDKKGNINEVEKKRQESIKRLGETGVNHKCHMKKGITRQKKKTLKHDKQPIVGSDAFVFFWPA